MYQINAKEVIMNHEILTNELDEKTKSLIEKVENMENQINEKDKELSSKDEEIRKLRNELEFLKGVISNKIERYLEYLVNK